LGWVSAEDGVADVLALVVDGGDRQLVITRKTVESHLSHIYQKLGVSGRRELPDSLAEPSTAPHHPELAVGHHSSP
jgi:Bacterial regulatory proteins, luxR family